MKITVPRQLLNDFRRQCREAWPNETVAVLHGSRDAAGDVTITNIAAIPHEADDAQVTYDARRSKLKALKNNADWIGTIHSHPSAYDNMPDSLTCCHPSKRDVESALKDGEIVMGIVYVFRKDPALKLLRTEVHWYVPTPLPSVELV